MTLEELADINHKQQHRMLSMEIVASRDILEGEEIFIDYGEKWEEAWLEHVRNWSERPILDASWASPLTEFELNHGYKSTVTNGDHDNNDNDNDNNNDPMFYGDLRGDSAAKSDDGRFVATCWYEDIIADDEGGLGYRHPWEEHNESTGKGITSVYWKDLSDDEIFEEYAINVGDDDDESYEFTHYKDHVPGVSGHYWPCSVIAKEDSQVHDDDEDRFMVRIYPSDYHYSKNTRSHYRDSAVNVLLTQYPRSSIKFVTVPYRSDQHHPKAFRHHIEIRDEIFPEQWKNRKRR